MNKFIVLILLFSSYANSSMDMKDFPFEIPSRKLVYSLSPPTGFENLKVTFNLSGKVDNEIISIEIDTGRAVYVIGSSQLNIDFAPNLNEIRFRKIGADDEIKDIYFNIFYGAPKKIECGLGEFEYLQQAIKITVYPNAEPVVEPDSSLIESCKKITAFESHSGK